MPNQLSPIVEQRIVAFALAHPGFGPRRVAAELRRPRWGDLVVSPNGVWRCLTRHGLSTRARRLGLVAGYRAPWEPLRQPEPEPRIQVSRPGELVGMDCFFVGRLRGTREPVWQITAIDCLSSYGWAELVTCRQPTHRETSRLARRVAGDLARCGWRLERVLSDNGSEFTSHEFTAAGRDEAVPFEVRGGEAEEGRRLLSGVYESFTEGFTTADLTEAAQVLGIT